jgi:hypothetical protein
MYRELSAAELAALLGTLVKKKRSFGSQQDGRLRAGCDPSG